MSRPNKIFLLFWLVTWHVEYWVPGSCRSVQPAADPWTGSRPTTYAVPAVMCYDKVERDMSANFPTKESAMAFVNTKPEEGQSTFSGTKISKLTVEEIHE